VNSTRRFVLVVHGKGVGFTGRVHACEGTWRSQITSKDAVRLGPAGGWLTRAHKTFCGLSTEGCYSWVKPLEDVTCLDCLTEHVVRRMKIQGFEEDVAGQILAVMKWT